MKRISLVAALMLLATGCATTGEEPAPTNPVQMANETWVQNREMYYRNSGWTSVDARYQAEQDFEAGKTIPADRPPLDRRPSR